MCDLVERLTTHHWLVRGGLVAALFLAAAVLMPGQAHAWGYYGHPWHHGWGWHPGWGWHSGWGWRHPGWHGGFWVPGHWAGPYWVPGHWA